MIKRGVTPALLIAVLALAFPISATASEKDLGRFGVWRAFAQSEGGQNVCYMVTTKTLRASAIKRTTPYLMITHRPIEASTDVFSYGAGTELDTRRGAKFSVGKASFELFSVRDIAWARDALTDHKIAKTIIGATTAQAKGFSGKKGVRTIDDLFDVTGAGSAYHAISIACGLQVDKPVKKALRPHKKASKSHKKAKRHK